METRSVSEGRMETNSRETETGHLMQLFEQSLGVAEIDVSWKFWWQVMEPWAKAV